MRSTLVLPVPLTCETVSSVYRPEARGTVRRRTAFDCFAASSWSRGPERGYSSLKRSTTRPSASFTTASVVRRCSKVFFFLSTVKSTAASGTSTTTDVSAPSGSGAKCRAAAWCAKSWRGVGAESARKSGISYGRTIWSLGGSAK